MPEAKLSDVMRSAILRGTAEDYMDVGEWATEVAALEAERETSMTRHNETLREFAALEAELEKYTKWYTERNICAGNYWKWNQQLKLKRNELEAQLERLREALGEALPECWDTPKAERIIREALDA